jgi:hypothetical protein
VRGFARVDDRLPMPIGSVIVLIGCCIILLLRIFFLCVPCHNLFQVLSNVAALIVENSRYTYVATLV